jgi:hypothetical protein
MDRRMRPESREALAPREGHPAKRGGGCGHRVMPEKPHFAPAC